MAATMTGTKMQRFLETNARKRAKLLQQAEKLTGQAGEIEREIFDPIRMDPNTFLNGEGKVTGSPTKSVKGHRAKKGAQAADIIAAMSANNGTITTKQAIELFESKNHKTAANAVLMRMAQKKMITNPSRGVWEIVVHTSRKAK